MKFSPEDPRITAYALGEIEDPAERAEIEAAVADSPELQAAVADIQSMSALLGDSLASEPLPELSEFEKARLEKAPQTNHVGSRFKDGMRRYWPHIIGLAAAVAIAAVIIPQRYSVERPYALNMPKPTEETAPQTLHVESSLRAVEDLEIRVEQQMAKVEEAKQRAADYREKHNAVTLDSQEDLSFAASRLSEMSAEYDTQVVTGSIRTESFSDYGYSDELAMKQTAPSVASSESTAVSEQEASQILQELGLDRDGGAMVRSLDLSGAVAATSSSLAPVDAFAPPPPAEAPALRSVAVMRQEPKVLVAPAEQIANTERYDPIEESDFRSPLVAPLSTFSIDVDTASYANVRLFLNQGQLPPADAVRIEELINYFSYEDAAPTKSLEEGGDPFAVHMAQTYAPWNPKHRLLRIGLKGYEMPWEERPASNLVFLLDVSGSMNNANKLPLVKRAMSVLIDRLDARDRVAIVVYAGASGLVLPSTTANNHETIEHALNNLKAGGSTNGGAGIELAYKVARDNFIKDGNNRVILCTDGDFNVGQTNRGSLGDAAEAAADGGISLTILGFGMGNYNDEMLETLSNKGKGSYAYVDSDTEARKVFLEDLTSNLFKIAKDVKIQVEFNPAEVFAYRLIGYENRRLKAEDFNNDAKKAGDIGPGHSVVALYEIVPAGEESDLPGVDPLRYQAAPDPAPKSNGELATVKLRYKQPEASDSQLITASVQAKAVESIKQASDDVRFSAAVAAFGLLLTNSEYAGEISFDEIRRLAMGALGKDSGGHRSEFLELVRKAEAITEPSVQYRSNQDGINHSDEL